MIEKLKDFWYIFKNSKYEFYKDKNEALELIERVKYLKSLTSKVLEKNKEILNYLKINISDYPKYMHSCINDLVSLFEYGNDSKSISISIDELNKYFNFIYILIEINYECLRSYVYIHKRFKQRRFKGVKDEYMKLIKDLRDYEGVCKIVILDDFYDYDKI